MHDANSKQPLVLNGSYRDLYFFAWFELQVTLRDNSRVYVFFFPYLMLTSSNPKCWVLSSIFPFSPLTVDSTKP